MRTTPPRTRPALAAAAVLAGALLAAATAVAPGARAQDGPGGAVAVVVDRSASLRAADPEGRGPRLLAAALALVGEGRPLRLVDGAPGDGAPGGEGDGAPLPADAAGLAARLGALADAAPRDGGEDLGPRLARARDAAGPGGVVLVYTDDDLDVFGADGTPPAAALERARRASPRPARDEVNRAAVELLVEGARPAAGGPRVVALRAPLPPLARAAPFLAALGADVVELDGDDGAVVAQLAEALAGARRVLPRPPARGVPGRAVLVFAAPARLEGASPLGADGRVWVLDAGEGGVVDAGAARAVCFAPRLAPPDEAVAWAVRGGVVRVAARAGPGAGALVASDGRGGPAVPLVGDGPWRTGDLRGAPAEVEVAAALDDGQGGRVVGPRRRVPVTKAEVVLEAAGVVRAGDPLELRGRLPRGLAGAPLPIVVRDAQGASTPATLAPEGAPDHDARVTVTATVVPQAAGELTVESRGDLDVRLAAPVTLAAAIRRRLSVEALDAGGADVAPGGVVELDPEGGATLTLRLALDPPAAAPVPLVVSLEGAPEGAAVEGGEGLAITDRAQASLRLRWPAGEGGARCTLRVRGRAGVALLAGRALAVRGPVGWGRRLAAAGLLLGAGAWALLLWRRRGTQQVLIARTHGQRQLRAVGPAGRITFERYRFQEHASGDDLRVHITPEDSQASIELSLRDDGTVLAVGKDGAQLVHEDRPTVLAPQTVLRHGTAFAVVHNKRARRYVYLEHEPSAEELVTKYVTDAVSTADAEARESGVYVLLDDDDENLASTDALEATSGLFPAARKRLGEPSAEGALAAAETAPAEPPAEPPPTGPAAGGETLEDSDPALFESSGETTVSDEGIVVMDSTEASILDSQDVDLLPDEETEVRRRRSSRRAPPPAPGPGGDEAPGP